MLGGMQDQDELEDAQDHGLGAGWRVDHVHHVRIHDERREDGEEFAPPQKPIPIDDILDNQDYYFAEFTEEEKAGLRHTIMMLKAAGRKYEYPPIKHKGFAIEPPIPMMEKLHRNQKKLEQQQQDIVDLRKLFLFSLLWFFLAVFIVSLLRKYLRKRRRQRVRTRRTFGGNLVYDEEEGIEYPPRPREIKERRD